MIRSTLAALLCLATPAMSFDIPDELAQANFLPGWRDGATHIAGLTIQLAPGWKTYWRSPGDSGIPPSFNWSGSSNISNVQVQFPVPKIYDAHGMRSIGYQDTVTFPLLIETRDGALPISLQGEVSIGVCEEVCIPVTLKVSANMPAGGSRDLSLATLLDDKPEMGGRLTCEITPIADGLRMTAVASVSRLSGETVAIIETGDPDVWVSAPVVQRKGGKLHAEVEMVAPTAKPFALARSEVRMTVMSGGRAIEMVGC